MFEGMDCAAPQVVASLRRQGATAMRAKIWMTIALCVALLPAGCATPGNASDHLLGIWGGPHAGASFQGGLADLTFDCASGTIDDPIYPTQDGAFSAKGTYRTGAPGPVKVGQFFKSQDAVYSGQVAKAAAKGGPRVMTLSVTLDDGTALGPFTLSEGTPPQITRCL